MKKKVAIITVDYNGHKDTNELLSSSQKLDLDGLEILWLVVDNGSETSIEETVKKYPEVLWMQTGANLGFAGGFNRGMKYAKEWGADYLLIINNDTLIGDNKLIKKMLQVLEKHDKAGLVSPKIYFAKGYEFQDKYKRDELGKVIWYAGGEFDWNNVQSVHRGIDEVDHGKYDKTEKTGFSTGCCLLVKREVLEKVGYFDEKLFAYFEDNDWIERVRRAGFEQYYLGDTYIYHKVSQTAGIASDRTDYLLTRNRIWFAMKYAKPRTKLAIIREAIRFLYSGRPAQKEGVVDYFRGVWGWKRLKNPQKIDFPLELSILIINYKTTKLTIQLLDSIFKNRSGFNDVAGGAEIVVLDNSPDDPCKHEVLAKYPNIKFISNSVNNGFSRGNNQLINYSLGKYVLLLNSDMEVKEHSLTKLMKAAYKLGDRALYGGRLFFPDGTLQDSVFRLPNAWKAFQQYFLNIPGSYFMSAPKSKEIKKVEGLVMACFLIPKRVINEIGIIQEETFMYFEDIEYCRRAMQFGIPVYYVPEAEFIHYHGQSSKKAGTDVSYQRNVEAAKWYHGKMGYFLVTAVLWAGQKWNKITKRVLVPESRWTKE